MRSEIKKVKKHRKRKNRDSAAAASLASECLAQHKKRVKAEGNAVLPDKVSHTQDPLLAAGVIVWDHWYHPDGSETKKFNGAYIQPRHGADSAEFYFATFEEYNNARVLVNEAGVVHERQLVEDRVIHLHGKPTEIKAMMMKRCEEMKTSGERLRKRLHSMTQHQEPEPEPEEDHGAYCVAGDHYVPSITMWPRCTDCQECVPEPEPVALESRVDHPRVGIAEHL